MITRSKALGSRRNFLRSLGLLFLAGLFPNLLGCRRRSSEGEIEQASASSRPTTSAVVRSSSTIPTSAAVSKVAIVHGSEVELMVAQALELLSFPLSFNDNGGVFLKPNLVAAGRFLEGGSAGIVTDVRVVSALVKIFGEAGASSFKVGDGTETGTTSEAFDDAGYDDLAAQADVELIDLNNTATVSMKDPEARFLKRVELPKVVADAGRFINLPVLKTDPLTQVSLGLSNLMGLLPLKIYDRKDLQNQVEKVLTDLNAYRPSNLVLIDGLTALEGGGPLTGERVPMNLLVASENVVAADSIACRIMGFFPEEIPSLVVASEAGLGPIGLDEIEVVGQSLTAVSRQFKRALR